MVIKALLDVSIKGVGRLHKTSIFPCGIFQLARGINRAPGDPNYDLYRLALQSTSLRLYPNYANCDVSMQKDWVKYDRDMRENYINTLDNSDYNALMVLLETMPELKDILLLDVVKEKLNEKIVVNREAIPIEIMSTMGCRTQNGADICGIESFKNNIQSLLKFGRLYDDYVSCAQKDGRGNICPVTIILPTLAMEAKARVEKEYAADLMYNPFGVTSEHYIDAFMDILDGKIHEAKDMLIERFEYICSQSPDSAKFMYENGVMEGYVPEEGIRSALKHGTLAVGQIGLAEALQILIGCDHTSSEGMDAAKRIEQLFKTRCAEFKEKYKLNFGVYYTPAENLCFTAMKKFKEMYGEIPNVSDKKFFTNSIHVPVWVNVTPFEKINIESQLTGYSSAGCITYVELDAGVKYNIDALETIVNYAMDKDVPYFAVNVPNDMCTQCGYTDYINNACPMCGCTKIRRLRRVTGYLTGDYQEAFNEGKQQEVEMRVKHEKFTETEKEKKEC